MLDAISQVAIALFGVSAIWLAGARTVRQRRWAYVCGLVAQPFWLTTTLLNAQWGIVVMCVFYTFAWGRGFVNHWIRQQPTANSH